MEQEIKQQNQRLFKKPFSFSGRIRRTEYWLTYIIYTIVTVISELLMNTQMTNIGVTELLIYVAVMAVLCWFCFAQGAKRCHDLGHNGWWQLIPFYVIWMLFVKGQAEANKYGNPLA